ncbi:MAG TPA: hypothetical protein VFU41_11105 [Gemmatimonadales bacterium]|nr:hypothetical protein [Gemmatimonadales bacterium]
MTFLFDAAQARDWVTPQSGGNMVTLERGDDFLNAVVVEDCLRDQQGGGGVTLLDAE